MNSENILIGDRIKRARMVLGLTQTELGEKLGLGLRQIQKIEKGEAGVTVDRIEEVAKTLNVPVSYFFSTLQDGNDIAFGVMPENSSTQFKKASALQDGIVCEYTRNEEMLRLIFPVNISTEEMKEKLDVLVTGIFGSRIHE
jgi:transcriptional regulator with XRE-family HTH domain